MKTSSLIDLNTQNALSVVEYAGKGNSETQYSAVNLNHRYFLRGIHQQEFAPIELRYFLKDAVQLPVLSINNRIKKRLLDIVISSIAIVFFLSWMIPLFAILIKLDSRGPVFFKQQRSGRNNKLFWCLKFRSMVLNEECDSVQASDNDRRITKLGAFLRRTSFDEFPQFFNVLAGDMSIVGPRPHMIAHTEMYGASIHDYMKRLHIKQGVTGWAQISGYRGETTELWQMEKRVSLDLWYLENWSFWLDVKIICKTISAIF
jgi:putative colanic acid biosysnthesis UDP-glucose lipid carrier transferase